MPQSPIAAGPAPARRAAAALVLVAAVMTGCGGGAEGEEPPVRIGAGSTVEQRVLAGLTQAVLEDVGVETDVVAELGDTVDTRRVALEGRTDVFWDYTGAAWALALGRAQPSPDPQESFEAIKAADADDGLRWLGPTRVNATLALFVRAAERPPGEEGTLSWLAGQLSGEAGGLCADPEYLERPSGYAALADAYAIATDRVEVVPTGESKAMTGVAMGDCYAGLATATHGGAVNAELEPVIDDQRVFPAFVIAPVVREDGRADDPAVVAALEDLAQRLDRASLAAMNARVIAGDEPREVAEAFLTGG